MSDEEAQPLLDSRPRYEVTELSKRENIYSYMVYVPPMSVRRHGHYCAPSVCVACALLGLTVMLQVSMTIIAGSYLLNQNSLFLETLVDFKDEKHILLDKKLRDSMDPRHWWGILQNTFSPEPEESKSCCVGAGCAALSKKCCSSESAVQNASLIDSGDTDMDFSGGVKKPKGKKVSRTKASAKKISPHLTLCRSENSSLDCAPPVNLFRGRWDELDANGDGVWTLKEAQDDVTNLGCLLGISAEEVWRSVIRGLRKDGKHRKMESGVLYHPEDENKSHSGMNETHFEWWTGAVAMCTVGNPESCWSLVTRGVFDGAMKARKHRIPGRISDLTSAVEYCQWMLSPNGLCDAALPSSFAIYRSHKNSKCGNMLLSEGDRYENPHDPSDVAFALEVGYKHFITYERVHCLHFQFFLVLTLIMWYVNLVDEAKDVLNLGDFVRNFKTRDDSLDVLLPISGLTKSLSGKSVSISDEDLVIESIARPHYFVCAGLVVLRTWVLVYMWNVGSAFVLSTHTYADLILNSLALAFIMELPDFLFKLLVSNSMKAKLEKASFIPFSSSLPSSRLGRVFIHKTFWGVIILPIMSMLVVRRNDVYNTVPVLEALKCACTQTGESCLMASSYSKSWWKNHWAEVANIMHSHPKDASVAEIESNVSAAIASNLSAAAVGAALMQLGSEMTPTSIIKTEEEKDEL